MNTRAPAGWLDDPTGRHRIRYWDGSRWTDHVQTWDGATAIDPIVAPGATAAEPAHRSTSTSAASVSVTGVVAAVAAALGVIACVALDWVKARPGADSISTPESLTRSDITTLLGIAGSGVNSITTSFFDVGWSC